jgi:hypothetical protein
MKHQSKFFKIYIVFHTHVKTQYSDVIKCFWCYLDGEYNSNKFYKFLTLDETIHQTSYTDIPEQNDVAEKNIGTLLKLLVLSCCLLLFLVCFGMKLFLL